MIHYDLITDRLTIPHEIEAMVMQESKRTYVSFKSLLAWSKIRRRQAVNVQLRSGKQTNMRVRVMEVGVDDESQRSRSGSKETDLECRVIETGDKEPEASGTILEASYPKFGEKKGFGFCLNCYKQGHTAKECQAPTVCRLCGVSGHKAAGCPNRAKTAPTRLMELLKQKRKTAKAKSKGAGKGRAVSRRGSSSSVIWMRTR